MTAVATQMLLTLSSHSMMEVCMQQHLHLSKPDVIQHHSRTRLALHQHLDIDRFNSIAQFAAGHCGHTLRKRQHRSAPPQHHLQASAPENTALPMLLTKVSKQTRSLSARHARACFWRPGGGGAAHPGAAAAAAGAAALAAAAAVVATAAPCRLCRLIWSATGCLTH